MSSLNIRDLPFVSDVAQADHQVPKVQGGQYLVNTLTGVSDLLQDLKEEAAKGPGRLQDRLDEAGVTLFG
jgi:hypothetical protein